MSRDSPIWSPDGATLFFSYSFSRSTGTKTFETVQRTERVDLKTGARSISATEADETSRALSIVATLADVLTVRAFDHEILLRARKERAVGDLGRSVAGAR